MTAPPTADPRVVPLHRRPWLRTAVALAATLVIGITLGRVTKDDGQSPGGSRIGQVAATPVDSARPAGSTAAETTASPAPMTVAAGGRETGRGRLAAPRSAADERVFEAPPGSDAAVYQVATLQYLAQAEALLTSFRGDARSAAVDAQMAKWAKDLLSSTRLLLDSPAASDPTRRRLLEDLELVLVQIVRLTPRTSAEERDLIDENLKDADVLGRLRTAIPAGVTSSSGT